MHFVHREDVMRVRSMLVLHPMRADASAKARLIQVPLPSLMEKCLSFIPSSPVACMKPLVGPPSFITRALAKCFFNPCKSHSLLETFGRSTKGSIMATDLRHKSPGCHLGSHIRGRQTAGSAFLALPRWTAACTDSCTCPAQQMHSGGSLDSPTTPERWWTGLWVCMLQHKLACKTKSCCQCKPGAPACVCVLCVWCV